MTSLSHLECQCALDCCLRPACTFCFNIRHFPASPFSELLVSTCTLPAFTIYLLQVWVGVTLGILGKTFDLVSGGIFVGWAALCVASEPCCTQNSYLQLCLSNWWNLIKSKKSKFWGKMSDGILMNWLSSKRNRWINNRVLRNGAVSECST